MRALTLRIRVPLSSPRRRDPWAIREFPFGLWRLSALRCRINEWREGL